MEAAGSSKLLVSVKLHGVISQKTILKDTPDNPPLPPVLQNNCPSEVFKSTEYAVHD
jgi:hypothetical protein